MEEPLAPTSGFQPRSWAIQRVGRGAIGAWLLASAAGWTDPGPGSRERVATLEPGISIHYERVLHLDAPTRLVVLERGETGALDLALGGAYANSFRVHDSCRSRGAGRRARSASTGVISVIPETAAGS